MGEIENQRIEGDVANQKLSIVSNRIEQARRNVEVLARALQSLAISDEKAEHKDIKETMATNVKILNETSQIK